MEARIHNAPVSLFASLEWASECSKGGYRQGGNTKVAQIAHDLKVYGSETWLPGWESNSYTLEGDREAILAYMVQNSLYGYPVDLSEPQRSFWIDDLNFRMTGQRRQCCTLCARTLEQSGVCQKCGGSAQ